MERGKLVPLRQPGGRVDRQLVDGHSEHGLGNDPRTGSNGDQRARRHRANFFGDVRPGIADADNQHALARERLEQTIQEVKAVSGLHDKERRAHFAYKDSLNTERSLHADTRSRLEKEERSHKNTNADLEKTDRSLARTEERAKNLSNDVKRLKKSVDRAETRAEKSEENEKKLLTRLKTQDSQLGQHTEALIRLQAMVDSLYFKRFKRLYTAPGAELTQPEN